MREQLASSYEIELSNCYSEIESMRQQTSALLGENVRFMLRIADLENTRAYENLIKYGTSRPEMYKTELDLVKEQLAACEKERDELFEAMQHPSYEAENDLRAKNQNLFNALMKSIAYSNSLNEQIKRSGSK